MSLKKTSWKIKETIFFSVWQKLRHFYFIALAFQNPIIWLSQCEMLENSPRKKWWNLLIRDMFLVFLMFKINMQWMIHKAFSSISIWITNEGVGRQKFFSIPFFLVIFSQLHLYDTWMVCVSVVVWFNSKAKHKFAC